MRLAPHSWYEVAVTLDDAQLIACIKALTVLERLPNFSAGSVSPVIWLFRKLSERSPDDLTSVIDWVLTHTDNHFLPFGSHNLGAQSLAELHALSARAAERAKARHTSEEERQSEAMARKAVEATHKLFGALRRHDEKAVRPAFPGRRYTQSERARTDGIWICSVFGASASIDAKP